MDTNMIHVIKGIALGLVVLLATIGIFEFTNLDTTVQDYYFNKETGEWCVDKDDFKAKVLFYKWPKTSVVSFGICCIFGLIISPWSSPLRKHKKFMVLMTASLAFVPLVVNVGKATSNVHCPYELSLYDGKHPYVHTFQPFKNGERPEGRGRGFPAGHSTAGFSLMMLGFTLRGRWQRLLGFAFGATLGWILGGYQMLRGAHFLSHTIVSAELAWIIILSLILINHKWESSRVSTPL
jgi:membrane-associated PAP2 superfamily phosphatase